ncbi:MAG: hypothetical protein RIE53_10380 [Rhodothermales bacterium]
MIQNSLDFVSANSHSARLLLIYVLLQFGGAVWNYEVLSQPVVPLGTEVTEVGAYRELSLFIAAGDLIIFDSDSRQWTGHDLSIPNGYLSENAHPAWYSSAVNLSTDEIWLWDRSVGATVKVLVSDSLYVDFRPRRSSQTQFEHAGGLNPHTGSPIAFSGYGYYRAKDFVVEFDPELNTWREISVIEGPTPSPRMGGVSGFGFSDSLFVVVGGKQQVRNSNPPIYSDPVQDAWALDLDRKKWTRLPFEPWLECHIESTARNLGQLPADRARSSLLFLITELCHVPSGNVSLINNVVEWRPADGVLRSIGILDRIPQPQKLAQLHHTVGLDSIRLGFLAKDSSVPFVDWDYTEVRVPRVDDGEWLRLSPPPKTLGKTWVVVSVGLLLLIPFTTYVYKKRRRTKTHISVKRDSLYVHVDDVTYVNPIPQYVQVVLSVVAEQATDSDQIDVEHLDNMLLQWYPDPESARTMRNKAFTELNDIALRLTGREFILRSRREDDGRRFYYRVVVPVSSSD